MAALLLLLTVAVLTPAGCVILVFDVMHRKGLRIGVLGMWDDASQVVDELRVLSPLLQQASGRSIVPLHKWTPNFVRDQLADVVFVGTYADPTATRAAARKLRRETSAVTIFVASENTEGGGYWDQLAGDVDISMGHRKDDGTANWTNYHRIPWWLPYSTDRGGKCEFMLELMPAASSGAGDAAAAAASWAARPGFAALLSSHTHYPRPELFTALTALGQERGFGRVDAPGRAFHNTEWPASLPNSHLRGKVEWLRSYRWQVTPEGSRSAPAGSGQGGYNTEKVADAHRAGAIPIYWGDTPLDPEVWNPRRIMAFEDGRMEDLLERVAQLETNASARAQWFDQPVLQPGAPAWLTAWCGRFQQLLGAALERAAARVAGHKLGGATLVRSSAMQHRAGRTRL